RTRERNNDLRQQVRSRNARRDDCQHARRTLAELGHTPGRLRQEGLRPENVVGEKRPGGGQLTVSRTALDQPHARLSLDIRDVLRHRRLADAQLSRGCRERAMPCKSGEGPQLGVEIHNRRLYEEGRVCISILPSRGPRFSRSGYDEEKGGGTV